MGFTEDSPEQSRLNHQLIKSRDKTDPPPNSTNAELYQEKIMARSNLAGHRIHDDWIIRLKPDSILLVQLVDDTAGAAI